MPSTVIADRLANPTDSLVKNLAFILGGALLTGLAAQINVPLQPVPFTLQTLAVAASGLVLGAKRGALSQIAYIALGACGAPVFAEFKAGPAVLVGPTAGYLFAFVLGAYLAGLLAEKGLDRKVVPCLLGLCGVKAVILALGSVWLAFFLPGGYDAAWVAGVLPFLPGALLKSGVLALGLPASWKLLPPPQ